MDDSFSELPTLKPTDSGELEDCDEGVWPIGSILDGRFKVLQALGGPGRSGMGVVYILETPDQKTCLAAKTFQRRISRNLSLVQRFMREARTWIQIGAHPNIVRAYSIDIIEAVPYLFMEYIQPDNMGSLSLGDHIKLGPIDIQRAVHWAIQCCDGLIHASESVPGLVHRDLKPENLLISRDGTLKVTDFGLVRCLDCDVIQPSSDFPDLAMPNLTRAGSAMGTPAYMAPEQYTEAASVTHLADQYAFGCCFHEALTGTPLCAVRALSAIDYFEKARHFHLSEAPPMLSQYVCWCPPELNEVIMRCLAKDPDLRWPSFQEVRERLAHVLLQLTGKAAQPSRAPQLTDAAALEHTRSLALLEGYSRAIRMRHLRENQNQSPYVFHLALASYFRCYGEYDEERRQLQKASFARHSEPGHEVTRRLAEHMLNAGEVDAASVLLRDFLLENPDALEQVLEPYIDTLIHKGAFDVAAQLIEDSQPSLRIDRLRARLYKASGRLKDFRELLEHRLAILHSQIRLRLSSLASGDKAGWARSGDAELFTQILRDTDPTADTNIMASVHHVLWPDLTADEDFSDIMAWMSDIYGELAELPDDRSPCRNHACRDFATRLDYPARLREFLLRDEIWLWREEGAEGCSCAGSVSTSTP